MTGDAVYRVQTHAMGRPIAGSDSCIATLPPGLTPAVAGQPALDVRSLGLMLRRLSQDMAAQIGETLHHADWVITADPAVVEEVGMHGNPDCVRCRASVDQALAHLADRPHEELLVGVLYWADPVV